MIRDSVKTRIKLYEFGKMIGLEESEIDQAKRMTKTIVYMCIMADVLTLIGIFSSRLVTVGAWYAGASIKDFFIFSRFLRFF